MKITLVGYMGAGKTQLGKALAQRLSLPFIDLDEQIEAHTAHSISDVIAQQGELHFRKLEREQLLSVLSKEAFVLSTGGGTPVYYNNMEEIVSQSTTFYLRATPPQLAVRLADTQGDRPLLAHLKNEEMAEFIAKHLFERSRYYQQAPHILDASLSAQENSKIIENILYGK
jgi:shikimate kinase